MKKIQWPSNIRVELNKDLGVKLDKICKMTHVNRPSAIKQAVDLLFEKLQAEQAD